MYLTDKEIEDRLYEHLQTALNINTTRDWFVICLQGSQNYGIADEKSDIDTKMLVLPTLEELVFNKRAVSYTHEMENKEHIDIKDVREYFKIFKKSNINFVEILFTDYWIANPKYQDLWLTLRQHAEELARINPYAAVSCMGGMAKEKRHALCHEYPSRIEYIEKFGYDPKQLSHLARIAYFLKWYTEKKPYRECIYPESAYIRNWLLACKRDGWGLTKEQAEEKADYFIKLIDERVTQFRYFYENKNDEQAEKILDNILYELIKRSLKEQIYV